MTRRPRGSGSVYRPKCPAVKINAEAVEGYKRKRRQAGAANATINRELAMLRRGFRLAV
jgi:hypothetical protein